MRIISGQFKGRRFDRVGKKTTRETADMVREAVFQMITIHQGDTILDLFAGSGAYAFEAISRGASHAYLSDKDKDAIKTIYQNADLLACLDQVDILLRDYKKMLKKVEDIGFNIIFIDPPYAFESYDQLMFQLNHLLEDQGYIVVETNKYTQLNETYDKLIKIKEKTYGIKRVSIYKKK
ncbi:16S rRNA (guanine(966)-N(2))-methyltransferase RsmD [Mycoplasmatota bacterium]|nr:16S rRNA (guanine(966)-N(2))-methyltransferase RsmD [Mycoplasmatota bacterium]